MNRLRRFILFLVGFSLPLEALSLFSIGGVPITPTKIITALLLIFAAMQWAVEGRWIRPDRKNAWVVAYFFSYGLAILVALAQGVSPQALIWYITTGTALLIYYFLIPYSINHRRDLDLLLASIGAGAVVGVTTALRGMGTVIELGTEERVGGLAGQVNLAGFNLSLLLPMMLLFFVVARSRLRRFAALGMALMAGLGIIMTLSRSAFVATAMMMGLWSVRFRRLDTLAYVVPVFLLLGLVVLFAPVAFMERVKSFTTEEGRAADQPIQTRLLLDEYGVRALVSHPIVGVGMGRFSLWASARDPRIPRYYVIHNAYLHVAAGQGLLGLIPYLTIFALAWRDYTRSWRVARRHPYRLDPEISRLGLTAIFLQISLLGAMTAHLFSTTVNAKMGWLVIIASNVVARLTRERLGELESEAPQQVAPETELPPFGAPGVPEVVGQERL